MYQLLDRKCVPKFTKKINLIKVNFNCMLLVFKIFPKLSFDRLIVKAQRYKLSFFKFI